MQCCSSKFDIYMWSMVYYIRVAQAPRACHAREILGPAHHVGARLEMRTVGGPATARRRSELGNRRPLHNGQLSSPSCSGRRFANFQRQRAPAGPPISVFCANAPRKPEGLNPSVWLADGTRTGVGLPHTRDRCAATTQQTAPHTEGAEVSAMVAACNHMQLQGHRGASGVGAQRSGRDPPLAEGGRRGRSRKKKRRRRRDEEEEGAAHTDLTLQM